MSELTYKRILLKVSGEALAGDAHRGLDFAIVNKLCDSIKERYSDMALINVKKQLALEEIVKAENVEASEEEIEKKYEEMAAQFGMKVEDVKSRITAEDLAYDVKSIKAFELVKDNAKVTEKVVTAEEFDKMNAPAEEAAEKETEK